MLKPLAAVCDSCKKKQMREEKNKLTRMRVQIDLHN